MSAQQVDEVTIEEIRRRAKAYADRLRFEYGTSPPESIVNQIMALNSLVAALAAKEGE